MDKRIDLFTLLKNEGKLTDVLCYPAYETKNDPYEETKTDSYLNPITIRAYVTALSFESLRWKYYGQLPMGSKQLIIRLRDKNTIMSAFKIKIDKDYYKCYKDDQKGFAIKEYADYAIVILEWKNV